MLGSNPVAKFIDPWLEDKVNSGIELSYRPASHSSLTGRYDNPVPELTLSPQSVSMNSATGELRLWHWLSDPLTTLLNLLLQASIYFTPMGRLYNEQFNPNFIMRKEAPKADFLKESMDAEEVAFYLQRYLYSVERLFTVRGQSYLSRLPKYWPPIPLSARRVCTPRLCWGGGHTRLGERGMGGQYFGRRER